MKLTATLVSGLIALAVSAQAQEGLVGKYSGTFQLQTQSRGVLPIAISLQITSAANGKLQATASRSHNNKAGMGCVGEYRLEGTYEGSKIEMKSEPGGQGTDCVMVLHLVAEGGKLKGTMGKSEVEFSK
jgi:hypothetical protein